MKKLFFMLTYMNVGGTEKAFLNLINTLSPQEYEVTLFLLENKGGYMEYIPEWIHVEFFENYEYYRDLIMDPPLHLVRKEIKNKKFYQAFGLSLFHLIAKISGDRTGYYRFVLRKYKRLKSIYDTAVAYAGPMDFITVFVLDKVRAKEKIQWIHFDVAKFFFNKNLARRLYPKFDKIFVVSDAARDSLVEKVPRIANIAETKHNVVSKELCWSEAECGSTFDDQFEGIRILTVGRLSSEKGQDCIPSIVKELYDKGFKFRWYLIGTGALETLLQQKIQEYGIEKQLILLGLQINPYAYYRDCDLYVQTSVHEGYCITIAEALAFGKFVITTDVAGARDQIVHGQNGMIGEQSIICEMIQNFMNQM